jgi:hypothetical protein
MKKAEIDLVNMLKMTVRTKCVWWRKEKKKKTTTRLFT